LNAFLLQSTKPFSISKSEKLWLSDLTRIKTMQQPRRLSNRQVQEILQTHNVIIDSGLNDEFPFNIYILEGRKVLLVTENGAGVEFPSKEAFLSVYASSKTPQPIPQLPGATFLSHSQAQSLLNQEPGWIRGESPSFFRQRAQTAYSHPDGRSLVIMVNGHSLLLEKEARLPDLISQEMALEDTNFIENNILESESNSDDAWERIEAFPAESSSYLFDRTQMLEYSLQQPEFDSPDCFPAIVKDRVQAWLLNTILYYRGLDFFSAYKNFSFEQMEREIEAINKNLNDNLELFDQKENFYLNFYPESSGDSFSDTCLDPYLDLCLLRWDTTRVWSQKEVRGLYNISPDSQVYLKSLERWSEISRNNFSPQNIRERWISNTGPIFTEFELFGIQHVFNPKYDQYDIDLSLLVQINHLISKTGYSFEASTTGDDNLLLAVLSNEEMKKIYSDRNVYFSLMN
jgi:hypothetical protein